MYLISLIQPWVFGRATASPYWRYMRILRFLAVVYTAGECIGVSVASLFASFAVLP